MKSSNEIELAIFGVIKRSENPISTREISIQVKKAWHTVDRYCLKLQIKGKVSGFRIGNTNAWMVKK